MIKKVKSPLHIEVDSEKWRKVRGLSQRLEKAVLQAISTLPANVKPAKGKAEITLLLTTDAAVKKLNHDFRGIKKPTNVLSFPQFSNRQLPRVCGSKKPFNAGDIAIAYQYVVIEAKAEHKILIDHVTHLVIHGVLHLFGYDHMTNASAVRMERLEKKIMADIGLPDPYAVLKTAVKPKQVKS